MLTHPTMEHALPTPSARQLAWHQLELYGFVHFTVNTFTDREWGYGDEPPALFNPTDFDAGQIVGAARAGGLTGLILTCKHHDGFCLWPSAYTDHSVRSSPWRGGNGDVVREMADACARQGLRFGIYLSPWDRNRADYGAPSYVAYFRNQLRELLGNYGPLFEVWFDGANGGDGYYGGANETRLIDKRTYYGWDETWQMVREMQPDACIFSDVGPDIRWVGNEQGIAGDPCWAILDVAGWAPGEADAALLNSGSRAGAAWLPAECDVSIRPGWFYHAAEDSQVKTPGELLELYFLSVGRGASLLLNLPPDARGRIPDADLAALCGFKAARDAIFAEDLARDAAAYSAPTQGHEDEHAPRCVNDGNPATFWQPDDSAPESHLLLEFAGPVEFDIVRLREHLPLGQRIDRFALDAWIEGQWNEFAQGGSIGSQRLLRTAPVRADKVRLRIEAAAAAPAISEISLFSQKNADTGKLS